MPFRLTPLAETDIEAILLHIAADNPEAALRWYEGILSACRRLGDMPEMGVARPDVRPELRTLTVRTYLVLYRVAADGAAEVIRVVHGARQWEDLID